MLMPSIFGENLLDDFFDYSFGSHKTFDMMNTDIRAVSYTHLTLPTT